ncbi:uncharacterized protein LOC121733860 isoform X1 [Aricia agestis]|uniref:uncharacterized protein LOC121733860 isoform X1 n=1 Tax=Aricia agestis TaxID=91739 RepID=UPI001C20362B|nr:uncharacterized protein LOC121733860 isoform X1 [Aricia agestis]
MISSIISRLVILVFGTLYPAYASYKAVRTKNLKEYVKWMMYWIVFALFTCTETFTDVFLSWFPFYYEVKIVLVLWLLSPATKGSSILYRKFVHPALCRREQEIDEYIAKAKDQGYHTVLNLGTKGVNYATTVIMQTAIKGGGGLVQQLRKSYSLSDLTECDPRDERTDEVDDVLSEPRLLRRAIKSGYAARRSASESNSRQPMYFPEVDVDVRTTRNRMDEPDFSHIKSTEDISSGYSSAENSASLTRAGSIGARRVRTSRTTVTTIKRPQAAEDNEVIIEELQDMEPFDYSTMPSLIDLQSQIFVSNTIPRFLYQYIGDQVKILQVLSNSVPTDSPVSISDLKEDIEIKSDGTDKSTTTEVATTVDVPNIPNESLTKPMENITDDQFNNTTVKVDPANKNLGDNKEKNKVEDEKKDSTPPEESIDSSSVYTSEHDNDFEDGDDEASFGTPDPSPKSERKHKGKYGKNKAPPPPKITDDKKSTDVVTEIKSANEDINKVESKSNIEVQNIERRNSLDVGRERQKSKSPVRQKDGSAFGKLLQLPGKLAFWNKDLKSDASSEDDVSRQSIERQIDEFQSCVDISKLAPTNENLEDVKVLKNEIIETSEELQKLIDAKLQTHPEYKFIPLHEEIPSTSKSTDV